MFSGIIQEVGVLAEVTQTEATMHITVQHHFGLLKLGESIAVNGICLTVTQRTKSVFSADISRETLDVTTAKQMASSQRVNLERALRVGDALGGHWVTGHVDGCAEILGIQYMEESCVLRVSIPNAKDATLLVSKGSVAMNGVSLTVNQVSEKDFTVMLIPHTLKHTNLAALTIGDNVNIEYDYIAKQIARYMEIFMIRA